MEEAINPSRVGADDMDGARLADGLRRNDDGAIRMNKRFWQCAAAGVIAVGVLVPATGAFAARLPRQRQHDHGARRPGVSSSVQVAGKTQVHGEMPFTGGDVAALVAIGGGAVAIGGVLVVQTRKRRTLDAA